MKKFLCHVCLVSERNIFNITPILDKKIAPRKVILCAIDEYFENALILQTFLENKNIDTEIFSLGNVFDYHGLLESFNSLALQLSAQSHFTAINLSCGSKLMTIAAQTAFGNSYPMFYIIPDKDLVTMIAPNEVPGKLYDVEDKISLADYFAIHGYQTRAIERNKKIPECSKKIFNKLISSINRFSEPLGVLNFLASSAENSHSLVFKSNIHDKAFEVLDLFRENGAIKYFDKNQIIFKDIQSRAFCNGIWLEEYIYCQLESIDEIIGLQDFALSLEIENKHRVRNEIDAAFLYNNTLYLIECKTSRMDEKGADIVYKMDTVKGYAGLNTKGILVSYRKLKKFDRQRAEDLDISVLARSNITPENFQKSILSLIAKQDRGRVHEIVPDKFFK